MQRPLLCRAEPEEERRDSPGWSGAQGRASWVATASRKLALAERASLCLRHLHLALLHRGERYGLIGLRRFYAGYFRGMPGAARLRADFAGYKEAATVEDRLLSMGAVADPGLPALRVAGKAAAA